jgi:hypothetical protein
VQLVVWPHPQLLGHVAGAADLALAQKLLAFHKNPSGLLRDLCGAQKPRLDCRKRVRVV